MSKRAKIKALEVYPIENRIYKAREQQVALQETFKKGYELAEKDFGWHSVDESLPPMDEKVIALTNQMRGKKLSTARCICFAHIVDKNVAKDYNGWNIPGVKFWMPCPELPEE